MSLTTRDDLPTRTAVIPTTTVYSTLNCSQCASTKRVLEERDVPYTEVRIDADDTAYMFVTKELGYREAPAITVDFTDHPRVHWSGHRLDMLRRLSKIQITED